MQETPQHINVLKLRILVVACFRRLINWVHCSVVNPGMVLELWSVHPAIFLSERPPWIEAASLFPLLILNGKPCSLEQLPLYGPTSGNDRKHWQSSSLHSHLYKDSLHRQTSRILSELHSCVNFSFLSSCAIREYACPTDANGLSMEMWCLIVLLQLSLSLMRNSPSLLMLLRFVHDLSSARCAWWHHLERTPFLLICV